MRKMTIVSFSLATIFLFAGIRVFAQQTLPDYSKWQQDGSGSFSAVHSGKPINIKAELYSNTDLINLKRYILVLIFNEKHDLWLALLTEEIGERQPDGSINTTESKYYLFEYQNNKWIFRKSFQDGPNLDQETADFLKSQYDLVFKQ
jgi:hypothetical protein